MQPTNLSMPHNLSSGVDGNTLISVLISVMFSINFTLELMSVSCQFYFGTHIRLMSILLWNSCLVFHV
ncbi:hypothetical protein BDA96_01G260100 [Sorghum bicolor]|uniref:Uncharacterized protein n=1 Tax=Sorghum bicolor TaxID=4558 RepID=A0A921S0U7_SORBI|nr:hypothetical protein BDA96_01G260100 [Sorghum bicolor]